jgi:hypothetical protein
MTRLTGDGSDGLGGLTKIYERLVELLLSMKEARLLYETTVVRGMHSRRTQPGCRWRIAANQNTGAPAMQFGIFSILWTNAGHIGPGSDFMQTCARLLPDCSQYPISSLE